MTALNSKKMGVCNAHLHTFYQRYYLFINMLCFLKRCFLMISHVVIAGTLLGLMRIHAWFDADPCLVWGGTLYKVLADPRRESCQRTLMFLDIFAKISKFIHKMMFSVGEGLCARPNAATWPYTWMYTGRTHPSGNSYLCPMPLQFRLALMYKMVTQLCG